VWPERREDCDSAEAGAQPVRNEMVGDRDGESSVMMATVKREVQEGAKGERKVD